MNATRPTRLIRIMIPLCLTLGGCGLNLADLLDELDLQDIELNIDRSVNVVQTQDPRSVVLPDTLVDQGNTVIIADDADVIIDVSSDLVVEELPDITLVGLENVTAFDVYLTYFADDELQSVLIFSGETLLIEYPCLGVIDLVSEEDIDPFTGVLVDEFDLSGAQFVNPFDFECGDAVIVTIDPDVVDIQSELIDLVR